MEKNVIVSTYKQLHDDLSEIYYHQDPGPRDPGVDLEQLQLPKSTFDRQHGLIWTELHLDLIDKGFITSEVV